MSKMRRRFVRKGGSLPYRKIIIVATEGKETEPTYLKMPIFRGPETTVHIKILDSGTKSSPAQVLDRMMKYIRAYGIGKNDEAWLMVDRDKWDPKALNALHSWSIQSANRGLVVSTPLFEYWLLLHFEDGNDIGNKRECLQRLGRHCEDYDKSSLPTHKFTIESVKAAVTRAKAKDNPPCKKWPLTTGTTVYRLIERILP